MSKIFAKAISSISNHGILLIFPIKNAKEPASLWSALHPKTTMRWEWDGDGDHKVADLWHLREQLSRSNQVVYSKWFRNRATVMSFEVFQALHFLIRKQCSGVSIVSQEILDLLEQDSPKSTRDIKEEVGLRGREQERHYNAHMKELWSKLLIVGYGEFDDGAFPSLGVGATKVLFEAQVESSKTLTEKKSWEIVEKYMPKGSAFRKYLDQILK